MRQRRGGQARTTYMRAVLGSGKEVGLLLLCGLLQVNRALPQVLSKRNPDHQLHQRHLSTSFGHICHQFLTRINACKAKYGDWRSSDSFDHSTFAVSMGNRGQGAQPLDHCSIGVHARKASCARAAVGLSTL